MDSLNRMKTCVLPSIHGKQQQLLEQFEVTVLNQH